MAKSVHLLAWLVVASCALCEAQNAAYLPKDKVVPDTTRTVTSHGPERITRNIIQDRKGNIWIAAFDGIFRYDGKSFTNITSKVSSARFFSVLEDREGKFWFGTIGSGVYHYDPEGADGQEFRHFTTAEGLIDDRVPHISKDKSGRVWFGTLTGASRFEPGRAVGKQFQNYRMNGSWPFTLESGDLPPDDHDDVNSIIEDKNGKFWFGTRGDARIYDGKTFKVIRHDGQTFTNVRTIIEDSKGNIWLAGQDGLWRYDGISFTQITDDFVGYVHEDRKGNIWTSSKNAVTEKWGIARYDKKALSDKKPVATHIKSEYEVNERMTFGILEANDGSIWFGSLGGVYCYDGQTVRDFKDKAGKQ
ncbi:MAG: histidine kinase [Dyadobacter sp.]|uniref:ligand-binding sensor domain-containing protein n=1 Tax=Dyadobacter sp. TaxID=1914288 RepID=UPI001B13BE33|nr:two-component regulator propeller domain-containing protein [Dyadobacter sp.]MBO9616482.1 histidine kinase [Dyadobacter sp.]